MEQSGASLDSPVYVPVLERLQGSVQLGHSVPTPSPTHILPALVAFLRNDAGVIRRRKAVYSQWQNIAEPKVRIYRNG
jgi:hypothetical protein